MALAIAGFSVWVALRWPYAWIAAGLALASAAAVFLVAFGPVIEVYESHLKVGDRAIPWAHIRRLDRIFSIPLILRLTLADKRWALIVHAGDPVSSRSLLRQVSRYSREALIDGIPYKQFWREATGSTANSKQVTPPHYPLLMPDDEAEVERMFQLLKTVGHLDQKGSRPKSSSPKSSSDET
jgi:Protein of unknown function (DUF3093)